MAIIEGHASRNITSRIWLSAADAYYNVGGETSIDAIRLGNAADTLRLGAGMGARLWPGGDMVVNAEFVVAKPESEPNRLGRPAHRPKVLVGGRSVSRLPDQDGRVNVMLSSITAFGPIGT